MLAGHQPHTGWRSRCQPACQTQLPAVTEPFPCFVKSRDPGGERLSRAKWPTTWGRLISIARRDWSFPLRRFFNDACTMCRDPKRARQLVFYSLRLTRGRQVQGSVIAFAQNVHLCRCASLGNGNMSVNDILARMYDESQMGYRGSVTDECPRRRQTRITSRYSSVKVIFTK